MLRVWSKEVAGRTFLRHDSSSVPVLWQSCSVGDQKKGEQVRVYTDFKEAKNEIARDLNELGTKVYAGYQSIEVDESKRDDLMTTELIDYDYVVLQPRLTDLDPSQPWADFEWDERRKAITDGIVANPGQAWKHRADVWGPLLEKTGRFSYTYADRLAEQRVDLLVREMKRHPTSRQIYISIWNPVKDINHIGNRRVPCTLGYQITERNGKINLAYHMRSSDFKTHFDNDLWLAHQLQLWFCMKLDREVGQFVHKVGSLHVYQSDVNHVF